MAQDCEPSYEQSHNHGLFNEETLPHYCSSLELVTNEITRNYESSIYWRNMPGTYNVKTGTCLSEESSLFSLIADNILVMEDTYEEKNSLPKIQNSIREQYLLSSSTHTPLVTASILPVQPISLFDTTFSQHSTIEPSLEQDTASTLSNDDIYSQNSDSPTLPRFDISASDLSHVGKEKDPTFYIDTPFLSPNDFIILEKQETTISSLGMPLPHNNHLGQQLPSHLSLHSTSDHSLSFSDQKVPAPSGLKEFFCKEVTDLSDIKTLRVQPLTPNHGEEITNSPKIEVLPLTSYYKEFNQEHNSTADSDFEIETTIATSNHGTPTKGKNVVASPVQKDTDGLSSDSSPKSSPTQPSCSSSLNSSNSPSSVTFGSIATSQSTSATISHLNFGQSNDTNPSDTFAEQETTKECIICADTVYTSHFISVTPYCQHEDNVCRQCVTKHIRHEIWDNGNIRIICPGDERCREDLEEADVQKFIRDETLQRYLALSIRATVSQMPEFRWCANPYCDSGQLHTNDVAAPIMTCFECSQRSCVIHGIPLDIGARCLRCNTASQQTTLNQEPRASGSKSKFNLIARWKTAKRIRREKRRAKIAQETIDAYDIAAPKVTVEEETLNKNWLSSRTKGCPKCNVRIEKHKGCDHMTCRAFGCGYEFCWECLADYNEILAKGKGYHKESCKYYNM